MVGGFYDIERCPQNRVIYVEHGAGQSYAGDAATNDHPHAYPGASHPDSVIGYIAPRQDIADSWGRPAFVAGCPALDTQRRRLVAAPKPRPVAVLTFHWDAIRVSPEARSAKPYWIEYLHSMVAHLHQHEFDVLGTWHPRDPFGAQAWINLGVEHTDDPDVALRRADLLIADNTSLQYEAAKLAIPQFVLNAPWYRRDVEHGLRFWDHVPGQQLNCIEEFMETKPRSYRMDTLARAVAISAGDHAFHHPIGHAGESAARWIEKLVLELS